MVIHWWIVPIAFFALACFFLLLGFLLAMCDDSTSNVLGLMGMAYFCNLAAAFGALVMGILK